MDTITILIMIILIMTLDVMTIRISLHTGDITYNDNTNNLSYW
jgi:hypothetical protein